MKQEQSESPYPQQYILTLTNQLATQHDDPFLPVLLERLRSRLVGELAQLHGHIYDDWPTILAICNHQLSEEMLSGQEEGAMKWLWRVVFDSRIPCGSKSALEGSLTLALRLSQQTSKRVQVWERAMEVLTDRLEPQEVSISKLKLQQTAQVHSQTLKIAEDFQIQQLSSLQQTVQLSTLITRCFLQCEAYDDLNKQKLVETNILLLTALFQDQSTWRELKTEGQELLVTLQLMRSVSQSLEAHKQIGRLVKVIGKQAHFDKELHHRHSLCLLCSFNSETTSNSCLAIKAHLEYLKEQEDLKGIEETLESNSEIVLYSLRCIATEKHCDEVDKGLLCSSLLQLWSMYLQKGLPQFAATTNISVTQIFIPLLSKCQSHQIIFDILDSYIKNKVMKLHLLLDLVCQSLQDELSFRAIPSPSIFKTTLNLPAHVCWKLISRFQLYNLNDFRSFFGQMLKEIPMSLDFSHWLQLIATLEKMDHSFVKETFPVTQRLLVQAYYSRRIPLKSSGGDEKASIELKLASLRLIQQGCAQLYSRGYSQLVSRELFQCPLLSTTVELLLSIYSQIITLHLPLMDKSNLNFLACLNAQTLCVAPMGDLTPYQLLLLRNTLLSTLHGIFMRKDLFFVDSTLRKVSYCFVKQFLRHQGAQMTVLLVVKVMVQTSESVLHINVSVLQTLLDCDWMYIQMEFVTVLFELVPYFPKFPASSMKKVAIHVCQFLSQHSNNVSETQSLFQRYVQFLYMFGRQMGSKVGEKSSEEVCTLCRYLLNQQEWQALRFDLINTYLLYNNYQLSQQPVLNIVHQNDLVDFREKDMTKLLYGIELVLKNSRNFSKSKARLYTHQLTLLYHIIKSHTIEDCLIEGQKELIVDKATQIFGDFYSSFLHYYEFQHKQLPAQVQSFFDHLISNSLKMHKISQTVKELQANPRVVSNTFLIPTSFSRLPGVKSTRATYRRGQ